MCADGCMYVYAHMFTCRYVYIYKYVYMSVHLCIYVEYIFVHACIHAVAIVSIAARNNAVQRGVLRAFTASPPAESVQSSSWIAFEVPPPINNRLENPISYVFLWCISSHLSRGGSVGVA